MKNTALITFHAPYNYGSCLQAFALQKAIENTGSYNEIINYRFQGQRDCYRLIRKTRNAKDIIKDLMQFPVFPQKKRREQLFEHFIATYLRCTKEYKEPEELAELSDHYEVFVSGSDQIWNKHSNELHCQDWKYIDPYLLRFTERKKISYASSIGGTTDEEIRSHMKDAIKQFSYVSAREGTVAVRLSQLLEMDVDCVVDPTLLLTKEQYIHYFSINEKKNDVPYIFYYSLSGINTVRKHLSVIKKCLGNKIKIYVNTPYAYIPGDRTFKNVVAIGPIQFLEYMINAEYIVTDSFHGTAFSLNFEKQFCSICKADGGSEYRKVDLLKKFGCENALVLDIEKLDSLPKINYTQSICDKKRELIDYSKKKLQMAIDDV